MAVILYVNWVNGTGTYTAASPDIPDAHSYTFSNATIASEAASPWNGQYVGKLTAWNGNISTTLSSATMQATSGRILVEFNELDTGGYNFSRFTAANANNGDILLAKSGSNLRVTMRWNSDGSTAYVDLGTYPTVPFVVEVIYDTNNGTANQRLRARTWSLGGTAGSFNDATSSVGSAAATDQFTGWQLAPDGEVSGLWVGRAIVSDDTTEDLSSYSEGGGPSNAPRAMRHLMNTMGA